MHLALFKPEVSVQLSTTCDVRRLHNCGGCPNELTTWDCARPSNERGVRTPVVGSPSAGIFPAVILTQDSLTGGK